VLHCSPAPAPANRPVAHERGIRDQHLEAMTLPHISLALLTDGSRHTQTGAGKDSATSWPLRLSHPLCLNI